jgi:hypothetical protein
MDGLGRRFVTAAVVLAALAVAAPAQADIADFFGIWRNAETDASGIARIVVSPVEGRRVVVHLFGRCGAGECDWGTQPARIYASDPSATDIRSLAADFDTPAGHKHITLTQAVGHALRIDVQTDVAANSGQHDFATSGNVAYAGDWEDATRLAAAAPPPAVVPAPPPSPSPAAPSVAAPVVAPPPVAAAAPPPPPAPSSEGWFGRSWIGVGAARPPGYVTAAGEDCRPYDPEQVRITYADNEWQLGDFAHRLLRFGTHQTAARLAAVILGYYHFDEQCVITRSNVVMTYWKRAGQVPQPDMPGSDCVGFDPAAAKVEGSGDEWRVTAGGGALLTFDEKADAASAVSVIRTYRLNRQCFFARPDSKAQYWLSQ